MNLESYEFFGGFLTGYMWEEWLSFKFEPFYMEVESKETKPHNLYTSL